MCRGQLSTVDLVIASLIVLLLLITILETYNQAVVKLDSEVKRQSINRQANQLAELLIKSPGDPVDWENEVVDPSNVHHLGLVGRPNLLQYDKLEALDDAGYEEIRQVFGLGRDFNIKVLDPADARILYEIGSELDSLGVVVERFCLLNDTLTEVKLTVYER